MGIKAVATASETKRVETMETPIFFPMILIRKLVEKMNGEKTTTVVSVDAKIARIT
jgi:hypothetical protein